jgi:hypothetical protein
MSAPPIEHDPPTLSTWSLASVASPGAQPVFILQEEKSLMLLADSRSKPSRCHILAFKRREFQGEEIKKKTRLVKEEGKRNRKQ